MKLVYNADMKSLVTLLVFVVGLLLRLALIAGAGSASNDIRNFEITAQIVERGGNVYTEQFYYNYAPLPAVIVAGLARLPVDFATVLRLMAMLVDLINASLVYAILKLTRPRLALWGFTLVWLSLPLIVNNPQPQFDTLSLTPLLFALWMVTRWRYADWRFSPSNSNR